MIITIRDANGNVNNSVCAAALIAGMTAITKSKKTLILQFTPPTEKNVLTVMAGKSIRENSLLYSFQDDGLDSLALKADNNDLSKEHFDECVSPILEKENMLDVLKPTKVEQYKTITSNEVFESIITGSKGVYEYIYIIIPGNADQELSDLVTKQSDEDLLLIRQGEDFSEPYNNGKTSLVVDDYEESSKYDLHYIKKKCGVKKVYTIPHNVAAMDAMKSETLLDYLLTNRKNMKTDANYNLYSSLLSLIELFVTDKRQDDEGELEEKFRDNEKAPLLEPEEGSILPENAVQEVIVKKGLFRRKEKNIMINF